MENVQINKIQKCNAPSSISFRCILTSKFRACVVSLEYADVYEVCTASIIRVMKAVRTSKASVHFNKNIQRYIPEGYIIIFIVAAVRT
jgi:hypothetical protein